MRIALFLSRKRLILYGTKVLSHPVDLLLFRGIITRRRTTDEEG
jgi:hypothetical protein